MCEIEGAKKIASAALRFFAWLCTFHGIYMSLRALATKDIPNNNGYDSASWRGLIV